VSQNERSDPDGSETVCPEGRPGSGRILISEQQ